MKGAIVAPGQIPAEVIAQIRSAAAIEHATDSEIEVLVKTGALTPALASAAGVKGAVPVIRTRTPLRDLAMALSPEIIEEDPPPRIPLLSTSDAEPALIRGKVGLLAAPGGTGKSWALIQLAIAVATGECWFGAGGWLAQDGRTLLLLAEEDAEEAQRRLHWAVKVGGADPMRVAGSITIIPLAGRGVALTADGDPLDGSLPETAFAEEIRALLRNAEDHGRPYSLVILDPLSRFAGAEVEKDNAAATRFVQVVETFTSEKCGSPSVLVAHHARKRSGDKDEDREVADIIRGASALVDGVRWAAVLAKLPEADGLPPMLRLRVPKTNYTAEPAPLYLVRQEQGRGALRVASQEEIAAQEEAAGGNARTSPARRKEALIERLLEVLSDVPLSRNKLATLAKANRNAVAGALDEMFRRGIAANDGTGWRRAAGTTD
jgi:hypothetical protein